MKESYSQCMQDKFVLDITNFQKNGTYLDLGCRGPIVINNTYLLEKKYNWTGLSIDIDQRFIKKWNGVRNTDNVLLSDVLKLDYKKVLSNYFKTKNIDYLSFDLEPPLVTLEALRNVPFDEYKFKVITFEHDEYRGYNTVNPSREIFKKFGYKRIKTEIMEKYHKNITKSEDWFIHPDLISVPATMIEPNW